MKHLQQSFLFSFLLVFLFLVLGFASINDKEENHSIANETVNALQSLESQFILFNEMSDYLDNRTQNRFLSDYTQRLDSSFMALHRDFSKLIIENQVEIDYTLLPKDAAFLQALKAKSRFDNSQFLDLINTSLNRLETKLDKFPASRETTGFPAMIQRISETQQRWENTTVGMELLNDELLASN